jgi:ribosome-associated heat shock protein Hsp15
MAAEDAEVAPLEAPVAAIAVVEPHEAEGVALAPTVVALDAVERTAERAVMAEPEMIEVWRPGRSEGRRRPQDEHRHTGRQFAKPKDGTHHDAAAAGAPRAAASAPADVSAVPAEQTTAAKQIASELPEPEQHSRHRRRHGADQRFDRPRRERERPPLNATRHERHERHERREKAPDPNSPFAKLAALKAQLEAEAKERR